MGWAKVVTQQARGCSPKATRMRLSEPAVRAGTVSKTIMSAPQIPRRRSSLLVAPTSPRLLSSSLEIRDSKWFVVSSRTRCQQPPLVFLQQRMRPLSQLCSLQADQWDLKDTISSSSRRYFRRWASIKRALEALATKHTTKRAKYSLCRQT